MVTNCLSRVDKGKAEPIETDSLAGELLETNKCYVLDCGLEVFVWMGRNTSLDERKSASRYADVTSLLSLSVLFSILFRIFTILKFLLVNKQEIVSTADRPRSHIIRVIEGFETVMFKSKFDSWPQTADVAVSEDGRGRVAGQC